MKTGVTCNMTETTDSCIHAYGGFDAISDASHSCGMSTIPQKPAAFKAGSSLETDGTFIIEKDADVETAARWQSADARRSPSLYRGSLGRLQLASVEHKSAWEEIVWDGSILMGQTSFCKHDSRHSS